MLHCFLQTGRFLCDFKLKIFIEISQQWSTPSVMCPDSSQETLLAFWHDKTLRLNPCSVPSKLEAFHLLRRLELKHLEPMFEDENQRSNHYDEGVMLAVVVSLVRSHRYYWAWKFIPHWQTSSIIKQNQPRTLKPWESRRIAKCTGQRLPKLQPNRINLGGCHKSSDSRSSIHQQNEPRWCIPIPAPNPSYPSCTKSQVDLTRQPKMHCPAGLA